MEKKKTVKKIGKKEPLKKKEPVVNFGDQIDTDDKRKVAVSMLMIGKSSQFWTLLCNVLDYNIQETERVILEEDLDFEQTKDFKRKLYYQKQLRSLPDTLIERYTPSDNKKTDTNLDPFD